MKILISYRAIDNVAGGVERMATCLMNAMVKRGHDVHFLTLDHKDAISFYPMDSAITWHKMDLGDYRQKASWRLRWERAKLGRNIIKDIAPDIIIGFQDGAFFSMRAYSMGLRIPVILAERICPGHFDFVKAGRLRPIIYQLYRLAKLITVQCESYIKEYPRYLQHKIKTIPNPVFPVSGKANPEGQDNNEKILLCMGRVGYQKNQHCLVQSFAKLHKKYPTWKLVLAGGISHEDNILQEIKALNLSDKIEMPGAVKNVEDYYTKSHLFCLPSRWEGFPNALAEAMAYGLPAVGFSNCGGVRDLIQHDKTGLLAQGNENIDTLTHALDQLMDDDAKRREMGDAGRKWVEQFQPEKIYDMWEDMFLEQSGHKKAAA